MSQAFAIIGMSKYSGKNQGITKINSELSNILLSSFKENSDKNWKGFSDTYTYCAARPAQAMILAGQKLNKNELITAGLESLDFLIDNTIQKKTNKKDMFNAIGNNGWFPKGGEPAKYDQQPIEAGVMTEACIDAYKVTKDKKYLNAALTSFSWFHKNNSQNIEMITNKGGVLDAITPNGANLNQGAEPIIEYRITLAKFKEINVNPFKHLKIAA